MISLSPAELLEAEISRLQNELVHAKSKQKENVEELDNLKAFCNSLHHKINEMTDNEKFLKKIIESQLDIIERLREY